MRQDSINAADPTNPTVKPVPYVGVQFAAIPEFAGLATTVGETAADFIEKARPVLDRDLRDYAVRFAEVESAVRGIRRVSDFPIVAHMTLEDDGSSLSAIVTVAVL